MSKKSFRSRDLNFVAFCMAIGQRLLAIEKDPRGSHSWFVLEDEERCRQLEDEYYNHRGLVDPLRMAISVKEIKTRLYR